MRRNKGVTIGALTAQTIIAPIVMANLNFCEQGAIMRIPFDFFLLYDKIPISTFVPKYAGNIILSSLNAKLDLLVQYLLLQLSHELNKF